MLATPPAAPSLSRQFTGVGTVPTYTRERVFATQAVVELNLEAVGQDEESEARKAARRARAAKNRAERPERPKKNRGAYAHPPLRAEMPPLHSHWPPKVADAADSFDKLHTQRWDQAEGLIFSLQRDPTHIAKQDAYSLATMELMMSRFKEPIELQGVKRYGTRGPKQKARKSWKLEESIWAPRTKWADSRTFWDTDDVERKMFDHDWRRALDCGIGRYILRMDDDDEPGVDEVQETYDVLWEFHDLINAIFDYYAATSASDDITHMTMNAFTMFVTDCGFADNKSQYCKSTHFDQLFIAVDSSNAGGKTDEKYNRKKALNRQEFIQCLVKIAIMRYVMPAILPDVSEAVHRMLSVDIEPHLDPLIFVEGNDFRDRHTYNEECDSVLRKHEASLRLIYERSCKLRGQSAAKGIANKLVDYDTWKDICRLFELVDVDLTERDATLAFVWSRMRVIDEQSSHGRIQLTYLSFEDFLEAICRCAACKAWPTRDEIEAAETGNAGVHMYNLRRDNPEEYAAWLHTRNIPWGHLPKQHMSLCVDNMCWHLVVMCQQGKHGEPTLSDKEVNAFMPLHAGT